jgi:exocyst complex component 5
MEQLLNRGTAISELAYLRILQLVHVQTSLLIEDLKGYELPSITPRSPLDVMEFRRTLAGNSSSTGPATSTAIGTMLETAMEELFVQQTEGQRYLERESASLGQLYSNMLSNFTRYHVRIHVL